MKKPIKLEHVIEIIYAAIPYSNQITDLELMESSLRFTWRKEKRFRVSQNLGVEEVGDGILIGSDITILMERLLKLEGIRREGNPETHTTDF